MNVMLIQCSMRLSALLDPPLAAQCCACRCWRRPNGAPHIVRALSIEVGIVIGSRLGGTSRAGIELHSPLAHVESP
jgi:hypothetical protein